MNYILLYLLIGFSLSWSAQNIMGIAPKNGWRSELVFGILLWPISIIVGMICGFLKRC